MGIPSQPSAMLSCNIRQVSGCLSVFPSFRFSVTRFLRNPFAPFASNSANVLLQTRRCAFYSWVCTDVSNYRIKWLLSGVRYAFNDNVMLRLWRPRVTNCAIVSPRSQLRPVLTFAIPGEPRSLMVSTTAWNERGRRSALRTNWKILPFFLHFYFTGKHFVIFRNQNYFITFF